MYKSNSGALAASLTLMLLAGAAIAQRPPAAARPASATASATAPAPAAASAAASAATSAASSAAAAATAPAATTAKEAMRAWQDAIAATPAPGKGCFTAKYPGKTWRKTTCLTASKQANRPRTFDIGGANHVVARSSGTVRSATGSFENVTPANLTASGPLATGGTAPDAFSLQINAQPFVPVSSDATIAACGTTKPACSAWQQFIYSQYQGFPNPRIFVEYWLLGFGATCPAGWSPTLPGSPLNTDCYLNSPGAYVGPTRVTAADLGSVRLSAFAGLDNPTTPAPDTSLDKVVLTWANGTAFLHTHDNLLGLNQRWKDVEWNVVGDCCGYKVDFSAGTSMVARAQLDDGGVQPPQCVPIGYTAEKNNLNFGPAAPTATGVGPALLLAQSSAGGAANNCAAATSLGDTHLRTFGGVAYDFQSTGDFVLAKKAGDADGAFVVQARQVSGGASWPNTSINHGVATRIGKAAVAICLAPKPLVAVDGKPAEVSEGKPLALDGGVVVSRTGNVFLVLSRTQGDWVRAELHPNWMNLAVGLGRADAPVRGLLGQGEREANVLAGRDGATLKEPIRFEDLYHRYGESWRVQGNDELLLAPCGSPVPGAGPPKLPFFAENLEGKDRERGQAACAVAGVKRESAWFNDCVLDVVVLRSDAAALVFAHLAEPGAVVRPKGNAASGDANGREGTGPLKRHWPWWLLLAALAAVVLWRALRRKEP
ncbi:MAG: VWD domain-containing protein [Rubrivivax sp.]|nr:VWD domain-containing protein [Rubrivivax sp.]